jgi:hypothetical protein
MRRKSRNCGCAKRSERSECTEEQRSELWLCKKAENVGKRGNIQRKAEMWLCKMSERSEMSGEGKRSELWLCKKAEMSEMYGERK